MANKSIMKWIRGPFREHHFEIEPPCKGLGKREGQGGGQKDPDGLPVHSLTTLLADLATLTLNEATVPAAPDHGFPVFAQPTELQRRALDLLEIDPAKFLP